MSKKEASMASPPVSGDPFALLRAMTAEPGNGIRPAIRGIPVAAAACRCRSGRGAGRPQRHGEDGLKAARNAA
jgi:hypothetical protein